MKLLKDLIEPERMLACRAPSDTPVQGVTGNSAEVRPGYLFFAIPGHRADGHDYVDDALARGAAAVVVQCRAVFEGARNAVLVASTRRELGECASRWFGVPTRQLALVGVTGTNGKTTTTFLIHQICEALGITAGLMGTVEYRVGARREPSQLTTPDPISLQHGFAEMVACDVTHAAIEVSSIALDQYRTEGCHFESAVFTNLTQDHLDYHGSMEAYFASKRRLFEECPVRQVVWNADDPWGRALEGSVRGRPKLSFSVLGRDADLTVRSARYGRASTEVTVASPFGELKLKTPLIGAHNVANCLAALGACAQLGLNVRDAAAALESAPGAPGRLQRVAGDDSGGPYVFVDYAHSDDALRNVLEALSGLRGNGRILTVFGCGGDRDRGKRPKMAAVVSELSEVSIATSDNPRTEDPERILDDVEKGVDRNATEYHRQVSRRAAIHLALDLAAPEDIVLIAGKGHETYQIVGTQRLPFDDAEVVREYYGQCSPG